MRIHFYNLQFMGVELESNDIAGRDESRILSHFWTCPLNRRFDRIPLDSKFDVFLKLLGEYFKTRATHDTQRKLKAMLRNDSNILEFMYFVVKYILGPAPSRHEDDPYTFLRKTVNRRLENAWNNQFRYEYSLRWALKTYDLQ